MDENETLLVIGLLLILGVCLHFARMWFFRTGFGGGRAMRISRIVEDDAHLDFDARLAERLRELERQQDAPPAPSGPVPSAETPRPAAAPHGFGRRGL
jgi:hypothetical protein